MNFKKNFHNKLKIWDSILWTYGEDLRILMSCICYIPISWKIT